MITVGGVLANASRRVSPPRMPTSSSLTILTTCWAGLSAPETSAPLARSLMRAMNARTTGSATSASSSASRISRAVASMSASDSRPLPRSPCRAPVNRSDSDSNTSVQPSWPRKRASRARAPAGTAYRSRSSSSRRGRRRRRGAAGRIVVSDGSDAEHVDHRRTQRGDLGPCDVDAVALEHRRQPRQQARRGRWLRICTTSSPGCGAVEPQDPRRRRRVVDRHRVGHLPGPGRAVLRRVAVALVQRRHARPGRRRGPG